LPTAKLWKKHAEKVDLKKFKAKKRLVSVFHCLFNKISG
jgi:hypothetical protein